MSLILRSMIVTFATTTLVDMLVFAEPLVVERFKSNQVVPDLIPKAPRSSLKVTYPSGAKVMLGNELTPTQVKDKPTLRWDAECGHYYTIIMIDLDIPSRALPILREYQHWLVGNVLGCDFNSGETLSEYVGVTPFKGSGLHRYVFLMFKQPGKLKFNEPRLKNNSIESRPFFSTRNFVKKYNLTKYPVSGNFFLAQFDEYVPILLAQLGISRVLQGGPVKLGVLGIF